MLRDEQGFTLVELMVVTLVFSVIVTAMTMLIVAGQSAWAIADTQIQLNSGLRTVASRVTSEVRGSGEDLNGVLQFSLSDGGGAGTSDLIRFAVPVCACSNETLDTNGDVEVWGAPLRWGHTNCKNDIILNSSNKVDICHLPTGNPQNGQDLEVALASLDAHLAHGDYLGNCTSCDSDASKFIEYQINNGGNFVRRVVDDSFTLVREDIFADNIIDFQATLDSGSDLVTLTWVAEATDSKGRLVTLNRTTSVRLRNKN